MDDPLFAACGLLPARPEAPFTMVGSRVKANGVATFPRRIVRANQLPRGVAVDIALTPVGASGRVTLTITGPARGVRRLVGRAYPELARPLRAIRRLRRRRLRRVMRRQSAQC